MNWIGSLVLHASLAALILLLASVKPNEESPFLMGGAVIPVDVLTTSEFTNIMAARRQQDALAADNEIEGKPREAADPEAEPSDQAIETPQQTAESPVDEQEALKDLSKSKAGDGRRNQAEGQVEKEQRQGAGAKTSLTKSQYDALVGQLNDIISQCWNIDPTRKDAASFQPQIRVRFRADGALNGNPQIVDDGGDAVAARQALSAIRRCAFEDRFADLPPELYEAGWREITFRFIPPE